MRVLLVEDERRLADLVKSGLADEGFAVDVAHDGAEGLWLAGEHDYDAIVLDVMLPRLSGYAGLPPPQDDGNWTPIMILTAKDGEYDEAEALDTGADDFLSKPFSYVVLLARLRALVRRGGSARPVALSVGDLVVDPAGLRCRRVRRRSPSRPRSSPCCTRWPDVRGGRLQGRPAGPGVGLRLRRRSEHHRGLHQRAAPQDRRALRKDVAGHRPGRRLPAGIVSRWSVRLRATVTVTLIVAVGAGRRVGRADRGAAHQPGGRGRRRGGAAGRPDHDTDHRPRSAAGKPRRAARSPSPIPTWW